MSQQKGIGPPNQGMYMQKYNIIQPGTKKSVLEVYMFLCVCVCVRQ